MIVTCSACKTRYLTDPAALGDNGRMVRCAKCGHTWMQAPPADLPHRVDVISPSAGAEAIGPPRFNLPAPYVPPPRRRRAGRLAMVVAAAVVALVIGAGYFARSQIVAAWPPAQRVYDLIGDIVGSTSTLDAGMTQVARRSPAQAA